MTTPALSWRGALLPFIALFVWWGVSHYYGARSVLLVTPEEIIKTARQLVTSGQLWQAISASLIRELLGFSAGTGCGLLLGYALGRSRGFSRIVGPSFTTFKQISLFAWIPLLSMWLGLTEVSKIAFLSLAALIPVTLHTWESLKDISPALREVTHVYCLTRRQTLWTLFIPAALPGIFTGIYLALVYSWLATIGAEYLLVSGNGIGNLLIEGSDNFRMDLVLIGMVLIGFIGGLLNLSARYLEYKISKRYGRPVA